jgi:hypothetical protein
MPASGYENQVNNLLGQLGQYASNAGQAPAFFKQGLMKAFDYGAPLLKEAAGLEAGAYDLPGRLMNQYNVDYGNTFGGPSAIGRLDSILGRLGTQFGLSNLASGLAQNQTGRIENMTGDLTNQYMAGLQGIQTQLNPLMQLLQMKTQQEESARNRAAMRGGGGGGGSRINIPPFQQVNTAPSPKLGQQAVKDAFKGMTGSGYTLSGSPSGNIGGYTIAGNTAGLPGVYGNGAQSLISQYGY